ncbi:conserved hypothetical protein [Gammaproteobacteria bacterium]
MLSIPSPPYHGAMKPEETFLHIEQGAHLGALGDNQLSPPTDAQAHAGNYKMGRIVLHGLPIAIENPRGTYRTGIDKKSGKRWVTRLAAHYGYINGITGADGDNLDVFVGFYPQSEFVYVINQFLDGRFDEHKVMIAFPDEDSARRAYQLSFEPGWKGLGSLVTMTVPQFKAWLKSGDMRRPLHTNQLPPEGFENMTQRVYWNQDATPNGMTIDQLLYQVRRADAQDGLLFDSVSVSDILEDSGGVIVLDAMVTPYARLERKMAVLQNIMERVAMTVKPVSFQTTQPFTQYGIANVAVIFELSDGQTVSIFFHNPDVTPKKILPTDELVSWKWLLNKRDITIVVAPERGKDLQVAEVARRVLKLAEKNSAAFQRANTNRADRLGRIQTLKDEITGLEKELSVAQHDLEVAKIEAEDLALAETAAMVPIETQPERIKPEGNASTVKTAKGTKVDTGFTVVEADQLITSHDINGKPNPAYPEELQPRDRKRATSIAWVMKTANQLDPDSLGKTRRADTGAPIIGTDGVVESGNGRAMAIQEAYRSGNADDYRQWLIEEAATFGVNPDKVKSMKKPVLVRVRTSTTDRRQFAIEANQDDKLSMTATEKANADTDRLTDELIAKLSDDGDLLAAANRDFIAGFLKSLGDTEAAQYTTSDGSPTRALIDRVQSAIFAKAYNDDRLLELAADVSKPEVANVISALNVAAPEFVRARVADEANTQALTTQVVDSIQVSLNKQAVDAIIDATNLVRKAKADGMSVGELVAQRGLFGDIPPATAAMALFISQNNRSPKRLGAAFRAMAEFVRQEAERGSTVDMFGDNQKASLADIIQAANRELAKQYGEGVFAIEMSPPEPTSVPEPGPGPGPEPDIAPSGNAATPDTSHQKIADRALFQAVVDNRVAEVAPQLPEGILDPGLADLLEAAYYRQQNDPELAVLFEQAVNAYQAAMMAATADLDE